MAHPTILQAFTKILKTIITCQTLEQLDTCKKLIETFKQFEHIKDFKQWLHELDGAFLIRKLAINGELPIYDVELIQIEEHTNNEQGH